MVKTVILTVEQLGFSESATTSEIIGTDHDTDPHGNSTPFAQGRGQQLGLALCPPEVAPEFRLKYTDQPMGEALYVGMKPMTPSSGEPSIFVLGHNADGLFLDAVRARPDDKWHPNSKFLFCLALTEK